MEFRLRPGLSVVAVVASAGVVAVASAVPPPLPVISAPAIELSAFAGQHVDLPNPLIAGTGAASADPGFDVAMSPSADFSGLLSGLSSSGPADISGGLDGPGVLLDTSSGLSSLGDTLTSVITTVASIEIVAGVALSGLIAAPFALLGSALTSLGATIATLGGGFTPIGTAVGAVSALPAGIAELIETAGVTITQGLVTPIYDFLIKLVSGAASTLSADAVVGPLDGLFSGQGWGLEAPPADLSTLLSLGPADLTQSLDPSAVLDFSPLLADLLAAF